MAQRLCADVQHPSTAVFSQMCSHAWECQGSHKDHRVQMGRSLFFVSPEVRTYASLVSRIIDHLRYALLEKPPEHFAGFGSCLVLFGLRGWAVPSCATSSELGLSTLRVLMLLTATGTQFGFKEISVSAHTPESNSSAKSDISKSGMRSHGCSDGCVTVCAGSSWTRAGSMTGKHITSEAM